MYVYVYVRRAEFRVYVRVGLLTTQTSFCTWKFFQFSSRDMGYSETAKLGYSIVNIKIKVVKLQLISSNCARFVVQIHRRINQFQKSSSITNTMSSTSESSVSTLSDPSQRESRVPDAAHEFESINKDHLIYNRDDQWSTLSSSDSE
jgi:hypothetical protein